MDSRKSLRRFILVQHEPRIIGHGNRLDLERPRADFRKPIIYAFALLGISETSHMRAHRENTMIGTDTTTQSQKP